MRRAGRQLLRALATLAGIWLFINLLPRWLPEDPARVAAGEFATSADVEAIRRLLGLDLPWAPALKASASRLARGDLGTSVRYRRPVAEILGKGFPVSLRLALLAMGLSACLGWILALGRSPRVRWLHAAAVASPVYVLGPLLLWAIAQHLPGIPVAGIAGWRSWILPSLALMIPLAGHQARILHSQLERLPGQLGPRCWEALGVPARLRWARWLLPAVSGPWLTVLGLQLGGLLGGAVLVENIFGIPGLGQLLVGALSSRDLPLVQGAVLLGASLFVLAQLLVEWCQVFLDPRLS
ncbi:MAG: ABC transporter permease [Acidobacteria bacterium]|nr:ABC transporter permease [Acidobacteriota bacterium]